MSTSVLTSGYGQTVLSFLLNARSSEDHVAKTSSDVVISQLEDGDNLSFVVKHPRLDNVFYAGHEVENYNSYGHKTGAVSRWKINEHGQFTMLEVSSYVLR